MRNDVRKRLEAARRRREQVTPETAPKSAPSKDQPEVVPFDEKQTLTEFLISNHLRHRTSNRSTSMSNLENPGSLRGLLSTEPGPIDIGDLTDD